MAKSLSAMADLVVSRLKQAGFKIQRYDAYSTDSVYLKLDYGVCNSIRISDHMGKKHLDYRYNLIKNMGRVYVPPKHSKFPRHFYSFAKVEQMLADIITARDEKLMLYGEGRYHQFMDKNLNENKDKRGFWAQCVEV